MTTTTLVSTVRPRARVVPAVLVGLAVTLTLLAAYVDTLTTPADRAGAHAGRGAVTAVIGAALLVAAAVVLRARPRHRVGWVLGLLGTVWALDGFGESWSAHALAHGRPEG